MESISYPVFVLFLVVGLIEVSAMKPQCKGLDIKLTEEEIMSIKDCAKEVGIATETDFTEEKIACMSKCMMEKKGLIDENGKPHKENIAKMIDKSMPDELKADFQKHAEECLDKYGDHIDPKDETCKSYMKLGKCAHKAFTDLCK